MKRNIATLLLVLAGIFGYSQFSTTVTVQNPSCWNSNDGSYSISSIQSIYAPLYALVDSQTYAFPYTVNEGYEYLNHGSGTSDDFANSVSSSMTSAGPVYVSTGQFSDSLTFDGTTTVYATGGQDVFVACFDADNSTPMWAISGGAGAGNFCSGFGITTNGNKAYVTGYFVGTMQLGNASIVSSGGYQAYVAKIDLPTGNVDTIIQLGGSGEEEGWNIHYAADRVYLVGNYNNAINLAGNSYTSNGNYDGFVVCFDTTLSTQYWSATGGGTLVDRFHDVVAYVNNGVTERVYVVAEFRGNGTFGTFTPTSSGNADFLVMAIDTNGNFEWVTQGGSTGLDLCTTIDLNASGDRIYTGGSWVGTMNFGGQLYTAGTSDDGFIGYLDTNGTVDTVFTLSGSNLDFVLDLQSVDDDYLVFAAQFSGSLPYSDSIFTSNGGRDAFIGAIGPGLYEMWGKNFGGTGTDVFGSIRLGEGYKLHATGSFNADCSAYQSGLVSAGFRDVVVTNDAYFGQIDTTFTVTGLSGGSYVYILNDSNGNEFVDTIILTAPDSMQLSGTVVNASSGTANDGSIDLTVSGGTPGYTYIWSNGAISQDIDSLTAGNYCVTVTDSAGCTDSTCFVVDSVIVVGPFIVTGTASDLNCFGDSSGAIDLSVSGGVLPYSFAWSNGATSEDLVGIGAGTYTVTVSDNDTSVVIDAFTITQPDEIVITGVVTAPTSGTSNDGAIDVSVSGGVPPYTYLWSNASINQDINNLGIGVYTITVSDSTGCSAVKSFAVDTIPALSLVSASFDVTCINTLNGSIDLTVIGGAAPFAFAWSNGATSEDISGLAPGTYTVTVTDSAAQIAILSDTVGSNPIHPDPVVGPINGPASVQAWTSYNYSVPTTNGSQFMWTVNGGLVNNFASNAASIQWNAGPNGLLMVTETDANGCMATDSLAVSILFVGIESTSDAAILVYPNPAVDVINIVLPAMLRDAELSLRDIHGRLISSQIAIEDKVTMDISKLPAGTYLLSIRGDKVAISHKVLVN